MAFSIGTPNTQSSTFGAAKKPIFSFGVGATTTFTSGFAGFGTPATSTGFGSSGAPATTTATPFEALGATPASTAPFLFGGTGSGANAAKPTTGFGNTLLGTTPTCDSAAPKFDSAAPTFGSAAPTFDIAAQTFDSEAPTFDSAAPTLDSAAPTFDSEAPTFESAAPTFDGAAPTLDTEAPTFDSAAPTFGSAAPTFDSAAPTFDSAAPAFGSAARTFDSAAPTFDSAVPAFGSAARRFDSAAPTFDSAAPIFDGAAPTFDTEAPTFDSAVPSFDSAAPTFGSAAPTFDSAAPTFGSAAPTFDSAAPRFDTNILGGTSSSGTKPSTEFTNFGNTLGSAPQFGQMQGHIRCQSEQALQQTVDELTDKLARLSLHACWAALRQVVEAALSPEEEAAWARVNHLTSQRAAPPAPLSNNPAPENPSSVKAFRNVPGIETNIYFFTHDYREKQHDNNSYANHKEADMTLALANYLMQQGYTADDITILAAYSGQMFYMRKERQKYVSLSHVKITVVDNYQGEESKIILLSLVRNNEENIIGFLGTDNRVCVALSRAKEGLYIFGNINMMKTAKSGLWTKIATTLENNGCLGTRLTLKCQNHPDRITTISSPEHFLIIPTNGGCFKWCDYRYDCGHKCRLLCHGYDREHITNKCTMKCERVICDFGHICPLECCVDCEPCQVDVKKTLPCGHEINTICHRDLEDPQNKCLIKVDVTLPDCEHKAQKPCYQDINELECTTPCEYQLECDHVCGRNCHVTDDDPNHEKHKCMIPCEYRLECGHVCQRPCHVTDDPNHEKYICRKPCALAKAGCVADLLGDRGDHQCKKLCYEKCDDCNVQVDKVIPECLHTIKFQCKQSPRHELCNEMCERLMPCGHPCLDRCGAACDPTNCTEPTFAKDWSPCGHRVSPPCYLSALYAKGEVQGEQFLQFCSAPCDATLACKHLCTGSCVGCAQGRLHQPCTQQCNQYNICGHQCQEPCNQICPPCKMPCEVKCVHSRCKKFCCEPCTPCKEQCSQECVHGACSRRCGEPCSRAPCSEQCALLQPCGHRCRGLCGEPCPDICQLCRPDEFPKDFLGDQYEETDKFIVLQDCDHVLEVKSMDCLIKGDQKQIQLSKCPFCRKVIINTNRYKDTVNKMFKDDINPIKLRIYGTQKEIQIKSTELNRKVDRFKREYLMYLADYLKPTFSNFESLLNSQKNVSLLEVEMECMYLNIFEMIVECWKTYETQTPKVTLLKDELMEHIKILLGVLKIKPKSKIPIKISEQQQNDVSNEIKRLNVIVQLSKLLHLAKSTTDERVTQQVETTKVVVFSLFEFNEDWALESLKELQKMIKISAPVTKYERELIVKAIGLKAGHWYKCPKGHYYCIGECGGAMAVGRCPEAGCGEAIGGEQHTLTAGNSHAPEMDGSQFPAWSEQGNNMANFDPNDID